MLRAKTSDGTLITLALLSKQKIEQLRQDEQFFCPECNNKVIAKAGEKIIPHFAHETVKGCTNVAKGEGAYHEHGKLLLYEWLRSQQIDVELEVYVKEIKQRPDILLTIKNKRIAIEYQCAKIDPETIRKRTIGYKKVNIIPIWMIGANRFKRTGNNSFTITSEMNQYFHQYSPNTPISSYFFCPTTKKFAIIQDVYVIDHRRIFGKLNFYDLNKISFTNLFRRHLFSPQEKLVMWKHLQKAFRLQVRKRAYGQELRWRNWLYEQNIYIDHLPSYINLPVKYQMLMTVPLYNWQSRIVIGFIKNLSIGERFHYQDVLDYMNSFTVNEKNYPLLTCHIHPIYEYLLTLSKLKIIHPHGSNIFSKKSECYCYSSIEKALHGDELFFNRLMSLKK